MSDDPTYNRSSRPISLSLSLPLSIYLPLPPPSIHVPKAAVLSDLAPTGRDKMAAMRARADGLKTARESRRKAEATAKYRQHLVESDPQIRAVDRELQQDYVYVALVRVWVRVRVRVRVRVWVFVLLLQLLVVVFPMSYLFVMCLCLCLSMYYVLCTVPVCVCLFQMVC